MKNLLLCAFAGLMIVACGDGAQDVSTVTKAPTSAPEVAKPVPQRARIALVMKTLTNPFFIEMEKGARRAEQTLGVDLLVKTAAQETSIEQQIQIVDDLIAEKVNAIVIAPGDSQRLIPVLKKAADGGIKIVNIDNALDQEAQKKAGMAPVPFISVDNEKAAYAAAKYLIQGVNEPTEAAILEGIRSASNARMRMEGAKRAFGENASIKLVASESANWKIDEGHDVTQKILRSHPNVKVIFAANDMMGLGALKSLEEAKRSDIRVGAYDALSEAVAEVRSGKLAVTVDQQAAEQGFQGIATALRLLNGETVPSIILIDTRLVTAETAR